MKERSLPLTDTKNILHNITSEIPPQKTQNEERVGISAIGRLAQVQKYEMP